MFEKETNDSDEQFNPWRTGLPKIADIQDPILRVKAILTLVQRSMDMDMIVEYAELQRSGLPDDMYAELERILEESNRQKDAEEGPKAFLPCSPFSAPPEKVRKAIENLGVDARSVYHHVFSKGREHTRRTDALDAEILALTPRVEALLASATDEETLSNALFSPPHHGIFCGFGIDKSRADREYLVKSALYKKCNERISLLMGFEIEEIKGKQKREGRLERLRAYEERKAREKEG